MPGVSFGGASRILSASLFAGAALTFLTASDGLAQSRIVGNPRVLPFANATPPTNAARNAANPRLLGAHPNALAAKATPVPAPSVGEKQLALKVVYTDGQIYNPATQVWDKVRLRSYNGTDVDPTAPYVAPTIEVSPGDTVRITLNNELPPDPTCNSDDTMPMDTPHCFNGTNLHSHGLWISPAGNGDNVLLSIGPGQEFQYEYNIPPDHPAGTFWYHPHRHGSTALQVSSGMAGALIVRGNRLPTTSRHGDLDTLLKTSATGFPERVLVFQQIQYACRDADGKIKVKKDSDGKVIAWICDKSDVGTIESYDQFGPPSWGQSGRFTSINGQVLPTFLAKTGVLERWRMVHAGVRDTISLQFFPMKANAATVDNVEADKADSYIAANCETTPLPYFLVAQDGLTMAAAQETTLATFQPGYRVDALVVFPKPGRYCVVNAAVTAASSVSQQADPRRLLGVVTAAPGSNVPDVRADVQRQLVAAATRTMPESVKAKVIADLNNGLKLTSFTPHEDIPDDKVTGHQILTFFIDTTTPQTKFEISKDPFDPKPYDPNRMDRVLTLGSVDEWTLESRFASHPFHIHVNPFQIVKILDPNGKDVSALGTVDDAGGTPDPQYPGLKGVWKDTLWVKSLIPNVSYPKGIYTVIIRTRYERYIGDFVLHCHILDHEDQGMMENVSIRMPDYHAPTPPPAMTMPH